MSMSGQTDFLKLGTYMSGDKLSYLGGFNTNMQKIDTFAEDTATTLSQLSSGDEQTRQTLQSLNNRVGDTETNIVGINDNVKNLRQGQNIHTESIRNLQSGQESLENDITSLRSEDDSLDARVTALEDSTQTTSNLSHTTYALVTSTGTTGVLRLPVHIDSANIDSYNCIVDYTIWQSDENLTTLLKREQMPLSGLNAPKRTIFPESNNQCPLTPKFKNSTPYGIFFYVLNTAGITIGPMNFDTQSIMINKSGKIYRRTLSLEAGVGGSVTFSEIDMNGKDFQLQVSLTIFPKP